EKRSIMVHSGFVSEDWSPVRTSSASETARECPAGIWLPVAGRRRRLAGQVRSPQQGELPAAGVVIVRPAPDDARRKKQVSARQGRVRPTSRPANRGRACGPLRAFCPRMGFGQGRGMTICSVCGTEGRATARFCDACGAPLETATEPQEQRKTVTVVF